MGRSAEPDGSLGLAQQDVEERFKDHAWFIAFAPVEAPRIAVAVLAENAGFGASTAAPIARKVMDAYLLGPDGKLKPSMVAPARPQALPPGKTPGQAHPPTAQAEQTPPGALRPPG